MFKVKNEVFNPMVDSVVKKITSTTKFSVPVTFKLVKFKKEFEKHIEISNEVKQKVIEEFCDKNDDGKPKVENNRYKFTEEAAKKFTDAIKEHADQEVEFDMNRLEIKINEIPEGLLSVDEIVLLEPLIDFKE